jgi:hypothetical protein
MRTAQPGVNSILSRLDEDIVETLQRRREWLDISNVVVLERAMEAFAPVVARLVGS